MAPYIYPLPADHPVECDTVNVSTVLVQIAIQYMSQLFWSFDTDGDTVYVSIILIQMGILYIFQLF